MKLMILPEIFKTQKDSSYSNLFISLIIFPFFNIYNKLISIKKGNVITLLNLIIFLSLI